MTTFRKEKKFDPLTPSQGSRVCLDSMFAFMVICAQFPLIWYATWLLSEKKYDLTFSSHPRGLRCVCAENIYYHVAACIVSFNFICNMTIFWKTWILASAPPPQSTQAFKLKSCLICFISIAPLPACKISEKNIDQLLCYSKFKYLAFDPLGGGGGVKFWHCHDYLQALGNHGP